MNIRYQFYILCLASSLVFGSLDEAIKALQFGDYVTAHKEFLPLANKGDDKAMITIANFYLNGQGVKQDYPKAFDWYIKAMEKGNIDAWSNLAVMFREGLGVESDQAVAHALVAYTIKKLGFNQNGTMARAARIHKKVEMVISESDLEFAKNLLKKGITTDYLIKLKTNPRKNKGSNWSSLSSLFSKVYLKYPTVIHKSKIQVMSCEEYTMENLNNAVAGYTSTHIKDTSKVYKNNICYTEDKNFEFVIPELSSGKIKIYRTKLRSQISPEMDHILRFYDKEGSPRLTWQQNQGLQHAVMVNSKLPEQALANPDLIKILANIKAQITSNIPKELVNISILDGDKGKCVQTMVINQIPNKYFPQSSVHISPLKNGIQCIGISRMYIDNGYLIELGMVNSHMKKIENDKLLKSTIDNMDKFMSGVKKIKPND